MKAYPCTSLVPGSIAYQILELLKGGDWTTRQMALMTNRSARDVASAVGKLRRAKLAYRSGYTRRMIGDHAGPMAIYAHGCKLDAKAPPPVTQRVSALEHGRRKRAQLKKQEGMVASVFHLARGYR
jgi:hypothetical protein